MLSLGRLPRIQAINATVFASQTGWATLVAFFAPRATVTWVSLLLGFVQRGLTRGYNRSSIAG